jgi:WS/DGAT/MGAT family acyltransferase
MRFHGMSAADAAWLHMDRRTNPMVINSVLWFDQPIALKDVRRLVETRILDRFPRFQQRVSEGLPGQAPAWCVDEAFDPRLHFHHLALPAPGDDVALQELLSDLVSRPLDRDRPLWDVYVIDGYGRGSALLIRVHHAVADGIALARVMMSLISEDDFAGRSRPAAGGRGLGLSGALTRVPALAVGAAMEGVAALRRPARLRTAADAAMRDARSLAKLMAPEVDAPSALRGDLGAAHRVAWSQPVALSTVKRTSRALGATVNDLLVAAVAGAVGTYLRDRGEDVEELRALVPFNLRPLDEPLPRDLGNRFGLLLLALPVGVEDPIERVRAIQRSMSEIKQSREGALSFGILNALGRTPAAIEARLVEFFSAKGSMVLTNVPGPPQTMTLAGAPVRGVLVWAPCAGSIGMSISLFSYAGEVTLGLLVNAALVPDPQPLADAFRDELVRIADDGRLPVRLVR